MKKSTRISGILFVALALVEVITLCLGIETLHPWLKPFLIPALAAAALTALLPEHKERRTLLLALGLTFHTLGDIMLLFDNISFVFFAAGLASFLIGHFFYLAVLLYRLGGLRNGKEIVCWLIPPLLSFPAISFFDASGALRVVLVIYAITLLYVTASGILWRLRGRQLGWRIFTGGLLFIGSDAVLALNAFNDIDFPLRHAVVMGTYLLAEWFLVSGMVRQIQAGPEPEIPTATDPTGPAA
ncbi:MAG: lysoplasmalogenase [Bacteroidales bacterium]|nr:lysoplasmalogenase [Bacteroidales bacterium]